MNRCMVTQLEDLPVEIFIEIFDYFTATEIYLAFSHLNHRLNEILKCLPNLICVTKHQLDQVLSFFHSFKAIQIEIGHKELSFLCKPNLIKGGHRLFQAYPSSDNHWYSHPLPEIENIIRSSICSQLRSIRLPASSSKLLFKLIGKEAFTIAKHHCTINIDVVSSFVYEYSLDVDGKPLEKFSEKRSKISRMWTLTLYRKNYRIVLEKDTLDLWVNGQRIEADATFEDEGGEIVFDIGRHQANLKAVSSGNPRLEINHVLFVDEVEISQESEYDNN
ncbi:unnamed protein product [Rotaria sp. Silwood1]|nr:unnamed protein product [Rotaria sp. Silwood1]